MRFFFPLHQRAPVGAGRADEGAQGRAAGGPLRGHVLGSVRCRSFPSPFFSFTRRLSRTIHRRRAGSRHLFFVCVVYGFFFVQKIQKRENVCKNKIASMGLVGDGDWTRAIGPPKELAKCARPPPYADYRLPL